KARTNRAPAEVSGGRSWSPSAITTQVLPQIRHRNATHRFVTSALGGTFARIKGRQACPAGIGSASESGARRAVHGSARGRAVLRMDSGGGAASNAPERPASAGPPRHPMTKPIRTVLAAPLLAALLPGQNPTGELKRWHTITLTFDGPFTSETATPNPFTDYRLDVTFRRPGQSGRVYRGYWAADGNAADSGATSGNKWRVHFVPDAPGTWLWTASFVTGPKVAAGGTGTATAFDGATGSFDVQATDKQPPDFRALGLMVYDGGRFPRFAGTGQPFLEIGVNSPENVFAY